MQNRQKYVILQNSNNYTIMATIIQLALIAFALWAGFKILCWGVGAIFGLIGALAETKFFWLAVLGGLIAYFLGYRSDTAIINGIIIGGGIALFIGACLLTKAHKLLVFVAVVLLLIYFILHVCGVEWSDITEWYRTASEKLSKTTLEIW